MLSSLLESEFFPKWGEALWIWLKSDGVNLEQVAEWYSWWKSYFPEDVTSLKGVERGFRKGLDLMNQAMALGEDVKYRYVYITQLLLVLLLTFLFAYRLKKPDFAPKQSSRSSSSTASSRKPTATAPSSASITTEISFRSIVEDLCSSSNLLFLSTGRTTSKGQSLYRVSENVDGKGGVLCYLEDDVVWVVGKGGEGEAEPVGIEEMIRRAKGGK
jgi:tuftelin-interacting protein 11